MFVRYWTNTLNRAHTNDGPATASPDLARETVMKDRKNKPDRTLDVRSLQDQAIDAVVRHQTARLETWLLVAGMTSRQFPDANDPLGVVRMMESAKPTSFARTASREDLERTYSWDDLNGPLDS